MEIKNLKQKVLFICVYLSVIAVCWVLKVPCIFLTIFGFCCPGCGMTRAIRSALQLDFVSAFRYHPMFWSVPLIFLFLFLDGGIFKNKKFNYVWLALIGIGFIINWIVKLI